ncbi:MAG TPA: hypothetical protein VGN52_01935 [Burkholderiales bacterium]
MKTTTKILAAAGLALAAMSGSAMARPYIGLSIGVPAPVYVAPAPVYAPPPVYVAPAPVYAPPPPVYGGVVVGSYYGRPYYPPRYYHHGWYGPHGHWHR